MKKRVPSKARTKTKKRVFSKKLFRGKIDRGTIFIVVIMITLMFCGYIFVGGTIPETIPRPRAENIMSVDWSKKYPQEPGLQLHTFQGVTQTPYPTQQPAAPMPDSLPMTEAECGTNIVGNARPELIWAYRVSATKASNNNQSVQIFYSGADALAAGTRDMTQRPADTITNLPVNASNRDGNNFPISPAIFITDITTNPADRSGDARNNGTPQFPSALHGAWRVENGTSSTVPNGQYLGTSADYWPPANGPAGGTRNSTWTAEVIWNLANLRTNTGATLTGGRTYRMQIALHSGTQNRDVAELCTTFSLPTTPAAASSSQASILFDFDQDAFTTAATTALNAQVAILKQSENLNKAITIQGHTDPVGDASYNMDLSRRRANAVKNYMVSKGIAASRITALGKGETVPKGDAASSRRVEIYY